VEDARATTRHKQQREKDRGLEDPDASIEEPHRSLLAGDVAGGPVVPER
jgi:hypothetical protein